MRCVTNGGDDARCREVTVHGDSLCTTTMRATTHKRDANMAGMEIPRQESDKRPKITTCECVEQVSLDYLKPVFSGSHRTYHYRIRYSYGRI